VNPDSVLFLVGDNDNDYGRTLKDQVDDSPFCSRIFMTGKVNNVLDYLKISDLFVLPSYPGREGFPLSILEAMNAGVVPIGSAVPGIKDQLASFPDHLFNPGDHTALSEKINFFLNCDSCLFSELKNNFSEFVKISYPFAKEVKAYESLYESL
jgi:glycosyltransferase involved in cell wall biosynthesis